VPNTRSLFILYVKRTCHHQKMIFKRIERKRARERERKQRKRDKT
jgi:hypothetical protein